jgi:hypothetical protein
VWWIGAVFAITHFARKTDQRAIACLVPQVWGIVFLVAVITLPASASPWVKYALISLLVANPYVHPIIVGWNSTNANSVRLRTVSAS